MNQRLPLVALVILGLFASSASFAANDVRISQVYGGGGSSLSTATYNRDYVELFNNSFGSVDMSGWALEYGSAAGNWGSSATNRYVFPPGTVIQARRYFLIAMPEGGSTVGDPLPVIPDIAGIQLPTVSGPQLTLSRSSGKVALFTELNANLPCGSELPGTLVDKVAYGTASCSEIVAVGVMTDSSGAVRNGDGSIDTDNNSADFTVVTDPVPRNSASPPLNSTIILERIYNDCPFSTLTSTNNYPALISIADSTDPACGGFANLHLWRFSSDGATEHLFDNSASYSFHADLTISGTGEAEAGLQIAPWWGDADGRFNCRTQDGEIACFGGRLPFYSFTSSHGLTYVRGTTVHLEMIYVPNDLSAISPATVEYKYTDGSGTYSSGPMAFDEGNPAEDPPHGLWGQLNEAKVGGYLMYFLNGTSPPHSVEAAWSNLGYSNNAVVPSHTITASAGVGGTITPSGAVVVSSGADPSFTISPDACHHVADVLVDGISVGAVASYMFTDVVADHTIAASFASDKATLTLEPVAQIVCSGNPAGFTVAASGTPTPTFQWRKGGIDIGGETSTTLSFASALPADAGSYDVIVTNACGADTSSAATLTIQLAPEIQLQPVSQTVCSGNPVTFVVAATGTPTPTFQWRKGMINIPGATFGTYAISSPTTAHAGSYDVVVTNACGADTSSVAVLTVNTAPTFSVKPVSYVQVGVGLNTSIFAVVVGAPYPSLQWYKGTTPLTNNGHFSGVTTPNLSISGVSYGDYGYYSLRAFNSCGQISSSPPTYLSVVQCPGPPTITQQPLSQMVPTGSPVTFSVAASSSCISPTFQWYRKTGAYYQYIPGATQATYSIASVTLSDQGVYFCYVYAGGWGKLSNTASLGVPDPIILSLTTRGSGFNGCTEVTIDWQTNVPTTGIISYGPNCSTLTSSTAPTPPSTTGSITVSRPLSGLLSYQLTATMPSSAQVQSTCRTFVFPPGLSAPFSTAIAYPTYVQRIVPDDGIQVGLVVKNYLCSDITGPIDVVYVHLNGARPLDPVNLLPLPVTIQTSDLPAGQTVRMPTDFVFSRSQVGAAPGSYVNLYAWIRYWVGSTLKYAPVGGSVKLP